MLLFNIISEVLPLKILSLSSPYTWSHKYLRLLMKILRRINQQPFYANGGLIEFKFTLTTFMLVLRFFYLSLVCVRDGNCSAAFVSEIILKLLSSVKFFTIFCCFLNKVWHFYFSLPQAVCYLCGTHSC